MSKDLRMRLRFVAAVLVVVGLYVADDGRVLANTTAPVSAVGTGQVYGDCDEDCGPSASCELNCWQYPPELPGFLTTCGGYEGEPWNGVGQCLGECGDEYCNEYNDEDPDTCYEDCGGCGDQICSGPEELETCPADCSECGDDICSGPETCSNCAVDCNPSNETCGPGDDPGSGEGCEEGEAQNGEGFCCEVQLLVEGLAGCLGCGPREQCYFILEESSWGCVGVGESCGDDSASGVAECSER